MYRTTFVVTGAGFFPLDMLRYDLCSAPVAPVSIDDDVAFRAAMRAPIRSVTVTAEHKNKRYAPTVDRWRSFGWTVSNVQTMRV